MLQEFWGRAHPVPRRQELDRNGQICLDQHAHWIRIVTPWWPRNNRPRGPLFLARLSPMVGPARTFQKRKIQCHQAQEEGGDDRRALPKLASRVQGVHELLPWAIVHCWPWLPLHHVAFRGLHGATQHWSAHPRFHLEQEPAILGAPDTQGVNDARDQQASGKQTYQGWFSRRGRWPRRRKTQVNGRKVSHIFW